MGSKFYVYIIIIGTVLLSGCWSQKELTELAIVTGFGIDKNDDGEYVGTFQIIIPNNVAGGIMGGGGGQGSPVNIHTATGKNLTEVSDNLTKTISRKQYFSHTSLLVISEKLAAEDGLMNILDTLDRDTDFRTTATIIIAEKTTAEKVISTLSPIDKISAENIVKSVRFAEERMGENIDVTVNDLIKDIVAPGKEPVITGIRIIGNEEQLGKMGDLQQTVTDVTIQSDGLAIIKDGRFTGWLHSDTANGAVWVMDKIKNASIFIDWNEKEKAISFRVMRQNTDVSAQLKNNVPTITVHAKAEGNINGVSVPLNLKDPHEISKIEKKLEEKLKKKIEHSVQYVQKEQADIFGFGEVVHRSYPKVWKEIESEWNETYFPELKVNVEVDIYIRRSGLRTKPFLNDVGNLIR